MRELNFDFITDSLVVGSQPHPTDWYVLAELGLTVNISLVAEHQDRFVGAAPDTHLWLPTPDWYGPGMDTLRVSTRFIDLMISLGRKVYVHCSSGVGRSPTVAAAYLATTGMSMADALRTVKARRPVTKINDAQLGTLRHFLDSLKEAP